MKKKMSDVGAELFEFHIFTKQTTDVCSCFSKACKSSDYKILIFQRAGVCNGLHNRQKDARLSHKSTRVWALPQSKDPTHTNNSVSFFIKIELHHFTSKNSSSKEKCFL